MSTPYSLGIASLASPSSLSPPSSSLPQGDVSYSSPQTQILPSHLSSRLSALQLWWYHIGYLSSLLLSLLLSSPFLPTQYIQLKCSPSLSVTHQWDEPCICHSVNRIIMAVASNENLWMRFHGDILEVSMERWMSLFPIQNVMTTTMACLCTCKQIILTLSSSSSSSSSSSLSSSSPSSLTFLRCPHSEDPHCCDCLTATAYWVDQMQHCPTP